MSTLVALLLLAPAAPPAFTDPPTAYRDLSAQVSAAYDTSRGGFVSRAGVPDQSAVELAFARAAAGEASWKEQAIQTVTWTRGLMDTLTGGYFDARQQGDDGLGKRLDSNALRLLNLARAWRATGDGRYRKDAARVVDFMERVLLDGRGGFVTAQVGDRELEPGPNGMAIRAWLQWAAIDLDRSRRDFALRSLDRVWETSWNPNLGLVVTNSFGEVLRAPRLEDQVEMGRACLFAFQLCRRDQDRERARQLGNLLITRFVDADGGLRTQSVPKKDGSIRKAPRESRLNARAARFLYELAAVTGDEGYRAVAHRAWAPFRKNLPKLGLEASDWALAARAAFAPENPTAPQWANAEEDAAPRRPRSVRIKLGH